MNEKDGGENVYKCFVYKAQQIKWSALNRMFAMVVVTFVMY